MKSMGKGSLVYVEGEAQMQKFERKEGGTGSALSVVQSELDGSFFSQCILRVCWRWKGERESLQ